MPGHVFLFPDTNIFLHYPPFKDLPLKSWADCDNVTLVICLPVIDELDKYKSDPNKTLGGRAHEGFSQIVQARKTGEVAPGLAIEVLAHDVQESDFPDTLNISVPDNVIAHTVKKYQKDHPEKTCALLTEDYGMQFRSEALGLTVFSPDKSKRLPDPIGESSKVIRDLKAENARLQNKIPKLELLIQQLESSEINERFCQINLLKAKTRPTPLYADIDAVKKVIHEETPHRRNEMAEQRGLPHTPRREFQRYNEGLPAFYSRYAAYLHTLNRWNVISDYFTVLTIQLKNTGSTVATDIALTISFPTEFATAEDAEQKSNDELGNPNAAFNYPMLHPNEPYFIKPRLYTSETGEWGNPEPVCGRIEYPRLNIQDTKRREVVRLRVKQPDPVTGPILTASIQRLRHTEQVFVANLYLLFHSWEKAQNFQASVDLFAVELLNRELFSFNFVVTKSEAVT